MSAVSNSCSICVPGMVGGTWVVLVGKPQRVLLIPRCSHFIWLFAVVGLGFRYLVVPCAIKFEQPLRDPFHMVFNRVEIRGLHKD